MINPTVAALLNAHIPAELKAHHVYLALADAANRAGMFGCEAWLAQQSAEEREHMLRMLNFLRDFDQPYTIPDADAITPTAFDPDAAFTAALELERAVTAEIGQIAQEALAHRDFQSYEAMAWFVREQTDSERVLGDILARWGAASGNALEFDEWMAELVGGG